LLYIGEYIGSIWWNSIMLNSSKLKECMSDSVTNYNYVEDTKVSVSIKKANANKYTLSEIFLSEILKSFPAF